ncbi:SH3 domain-containing protein [Tessaracoccus sp. SD287]|uniref:SH3 domain-containing protein n=1 Tax=Tessaracoccus sp. SD287 TaxID=2782008 RepID=UPI001A964B87|nr:SH3 domain-containing protein [Tessaracoccus sp. SD287]MBO1029940.1 SH3 domain-containing protein [Tessaracoccus sp. SD287]
MTQSGRRIAADTDDLEVADRSAARGLEATDMDLVEHTDDSAAPFARRRKRTALLLAPMMVLGLASTAFALGPQTEQQTASPVAAAAAPSQAPSRDANQANRNAVRPSLTASSLPATSAAPSSTAPSTTAAPTTTKAATTKAPASKAPASTVAKPVTAKPVTARLGEVTGTRYTTTGLNVRSQATTASETVTSLVKGSKVSITSVRLNGFTQIRMNGKAAYVSSDYLTKTAPATSSSTPTTRTKSSSSSAKSTGSSSSSGGLNYAACAKVSGIEGGVNSNARNVARAICNTFPSVSSFGGYRSSADAHGSGRAIDAMISGQAGWEVANWVRANASSLGVTEVIYAQKIWTTQRSGEGWRSMSDRGSATANHYDHVHVTVR